MAAEPSPNPTAWRILRVGGFRRLWVAQLIAGLGDWIAMLAIIEFAVRVSARAEIGISAVMSARLVAGLLFAAPAGAIADRWSRRRTMITCHVGRAAILAAVPFTESLLMLVIASFGLEIFATLWAPTKEASVPNLVAADELPAANALSLAAAYGTFPIGALGFAALVYPGRWLSEHAPVVGLEAPALWTAASLFVLGAYALRRLYLPHRPPPTSPPRRQRRSQRGGRAVLTRALPPHVRAVFAGLAVGLLAAGSLIPLGPVYVHDVLGAGEGTFGLLMAALGFGVAGAVIVLALTPLRLPPVGAFLTATVVCGAAILAAASSPSPAAAMAALLVLGVGAGVVYLTSFSIVQKEVPDDLRGRAFAALYATVRVALLGALTLWPLASVGLDALSQRVFDDARVHVGPWVVALPGVRLALWFAAVAVLVTALIVHRMLRRAPPVPTAPHRSAEGAPGEPAPAADVEARRGRVVGGGARVADAGGGGERVAGRPDDDGSGAHRAARMARYTARYVAGHALGHRLLPRPGGARRLAPRDGREHHDPGQARSGWPVVGMSCELGSHGWPSRWSSRAARLASATHTTLSAAP